MEADDIMGSRAGLGTGSPSGYLSSSSDSSEDTATGSRAAFSCRTAPRIFNTVNAVPVGHVARVVVLASFNPVSAETGSSGGDVGVHVVHVTAHPRLRMDEYLSTLSYYGYDVPEMDSVTRARNEAGSN